MRHPNMNRVNPFRNWSTNQQCIGHYATTLDGQPAEVQGPNTVAWCARGWLGRNGVAPGIIQMFDDFLMSRCDKDIIDLNDKDRWVPSTFASAWEVFMNDLNG